MRIVGGRVLTDGELVVADVATEGASITAEDVANAPGPVIDARGLLVLPGMIDIHGDAFERQIMPRPNVGFDLALALLDTDRQLAANGITTAYHGVTWSWEPGLRGAENAAAILETIERLRPRLAVDTRYHLRHEIFNLAAEEAILAWIAARRIGCIAFNDHMEGTIKARHRPDKVDKMRERSGLSADDFWTLADDVYSRRDAVPDSIERIARAAVEAGIPALSHDDMSPAMRAWFHERGVTIAEFPVTEETAEAALGQGAPIVFGAPNVVRGGSHTGCPSAAEMVVRGLCQVLASDYYYPAMLSAALTLAGDVGLPTAWSLVSSGPAAALGLDDRGRIAAGLRADLVVVDPGEDIGVPSVVATVAGGRLVYLADGARLS